MAFERLASILTPREELADAVQRLNRRSAELRANRFTLVIVGEFKQGKSTVLNALLGDAVLPQKAAPCTAIPTVIRYGETPEVAVIYGDGRIDGGLTPQEFAHKYELKVADALLSPKRQKIGTNSTKSSLTGSVIFYKPK